MPDQQKELFFENPVTVSEYISIINSVLSGIKAKVKGEVSEMKQAASGHIYFSLKDENSGDLINCAIWSSVYKMCGVKIENGMEVIISGSSDVYGARGSLTFKVKTVELVGEGALKKAYDLLKSKLSEEGLFSKERKREVPLFPKKIGVITSKKGAAIHDFVNNLGKFGFQIQICDSRVEGQEAVQDLLRSIKIMRKKNLDVLVLVRGGGSLQSLMAFDNEALVREVVDFPCPVVAGIGHHEDVPLVALASDVSQSTPTATANYISEGFQKAIERTVFYQHIVETKYQEALHKKREDLSESTEVAKNFFNLINEKYQRSEEKIKRALSVAISLVSFDIEKIKNNKEKILSSFKIVLKDKKEKIKTLEQAVLYNDPKKQLELGYAIIKKQGKVVKSVKDVKKGDALETVLCDGGVESEVKKIK
ncbi:MAG: exodeoxyribonuclease VII large subunit [Candidatus Pacebacteria bacterium]|nr:exodeoxyribonuclease VII large subunit [Candidatus Paceibacterota bacterium]